MSFTAFGAGGTAGAGGGNAPGGGPAPAPTGFAFGAPSTTPAPGRITGTAPTPAAPAGLFGAASTTTPGTAPTPAAAGAGGATGTPSPAPGFQFGAASGPAPAAGGGTATSAAPASLFGVSTPIPATGSTAAPTPGATAAPTTFGATPGSTAPTLSPAQQPTVIVPGFDETFTSLLVWAKVKKICQTLASSSNNSAGIEAVHLAGQELGACLAQHATTTLKPQMVAVVGPDHSLRTQLQQKPVIGLDGDATKTRNLTARNLHEVLWLATDLQISETDAMALYVQVASRLDEFKGILSKNHDNAGGSGGGLLNKAFSSNATQQYSEQGKVAREFYFFERHLQLQTLLFLAQKRLENDARIIEATDYLLSQQQCNVVPNLVQLVRGYNQRVRELRNQVQSREAPGNPQPRWSPASSQSASAATNSTMDFANVHLLFCQQERQTATEILFFLAYHTQLTVDELTAMIDLIKDLSAESPKLSPYSDVPSAYEPEDAVNTHFFSSMPWQEKNPLQWQHEFVQQTCRTGQTQLMQCIAILLVAAMAAMETRHTLHNRELNGPNHFGEGNNLVPPNQSDLSHLRPLHQHLNVSKASEWNRRDIWGVLAFSYALLLRSTPSATMSPRIGGSRDPMTKDFREDAKFCLEQPMEAHTFTFCRLTLVPVLKRLKDSYLDSICSTSEFALAVLSERYSFYLTVVIESHSNILTSRKRWKTQREEELNVYASQRERQRDIQNLAANFGGQVSMSPSATAPVPELDLIERPDCLDDLMALATSIAALGQEFSMHYWEFPTTAPADGSGDTNTTLVPCTSLRECMQKAAEDDSLVPSVLSWLAAMSNDKKSAEAVDALMTIKASDTGPDTSSADVPTIIATWERIIARLRYTAQLFQNNSASASKPSVPPTSSMPTSYYYDWDGHFQGESAPGDTSNRNLSATTTSSRSKGLADATEFEVSSFLALITNVSLHSAKARFNILSLKFATGEGHLSHDSTLVVLFTLVIAPLTPEFRGATFSAIASLFQPTTGITDPQQKAFLDEQGKTAWEYLESCRVIPIQLLDQYRLKAAGMVDSQSRVGLQFPTSSMKLANAPGSDTIFPQDTNYQIIYEMEHVESKKGLYPSTEGLLELLQSLVCSVGCPSNVGEASRSRTGCTPYLEYIISFVIPRAFGMDGKASLPFRLEGDRSRLVARALAVVDAVLVRYDLPSVPRKGGEVAHSPLSQLGLPNVIDQVKTQLPTDAAALSNDFVHYLSTTSGSLAPSSFPSDMATVTHSGVASGSRFPAPKSPGFTVLFHLLSSSYGVLLKAVATVLTERGGANGIQYFYGDPSDDAALAYALHCATPPTMASARAGSNPDRIPANALQEFLKPLRPRMQTASIDDTGFDDATSWRERSIYTSLRILCAAILREGGFISGLANAKNYLKLVPVLRFHPLTSPALEVLDVKVSRLTDLLFTVQNSGTVRSALTQFIGYSAEDAVLDTGISSCALSIVYRMQQSMPANANLSALWGFETDKPLSLYVAKRLLIASKRPHVAADAHVLQLILEWILSELRVVRVEANGLAHHLLGLPGPMTSGNWVGARRFSEGSAVRDCFDGILDILTGSDALHLTQSESCMSCLCFEIIFRLYNLMQFGDGFSWQSVIYTARRLRVVDFWGRSLVTWLSDTGSQPLLQVPVVATSQGKQILHSIAWLLKGLACEIRILIGFADSRVPHSGLVEFLSPQPQRCDALLRALLGSDVAIMVRLVANLPLGRLFLDDSLPSPPQEALAAASRPLPGPLDVTEGYRLVDWATFSARTESTGNKDRVEAMRKWVEDWNRITECDCSVSHISKAVAVVFDAALHGAEALSLFQTGQVSAGSLLVLLSDLLRRLNVHNRAMDEVFFSSATRNLGNASLILTNYITSWKSDGSLNANQLMEVGCLLSVCIQSSVIGSDATDDAPIRHERTACLGSALSLLLRCASDLEPEAVFEYRDDFVGAIRSLATISCFNGNSAGTDARGIVSSLVRGTVGTIIDILTNKRGSGTESAIVTSSIPLPIIESLLRLVAELDQDVCSLLQSVALQPSGAIALISAGVGQSLLSAAKSQETLRLANAQPGATTNTIYAPTFVVSHLKLMSSLLTTSNLGEQVFVTFLGTCIDTLQAYRPILESLCINFPYQADVLRWFLKCLVLIVRVTHPAKTDEMNDLMSSQKIQLRDILHGDQFIQTCGVNVICGQIWEHPLPRDLQSVQLPDDLKDTTGDFAKQYETPTWWDKLEVMLSTRQGENTFTFEAPFASGAMTWNSSAHSKWNETKFEYCIVALDVLCLAVSLIKRLNRAELVDGASLARGLFRCALAASLVTKRLEDVRRLGGTTPANRDVQSPTELEADYLKILATKLAESVEAMLLLAAMLTSGSSKENIAGTSKQLGAAITASGLQQPSFFLQLFSDGADRAQLATALCKQIIER